MKERKVPMRRCIGCMESKEKHCLIRIVNCDGSLKADPKGKASGRGTYVCADNIKCLEKAFKRRSFERNLNVAVSNENKEELLRQVKELSGTDER